MTIEEILSSTGKSKEVIVEINSVKRSDFTPKVWYFSTQLRETGPTDIPHDTTMPGYLEGGTLGPLTQSLSEDLFSGLASIQPGTLKIVQTDVDPDELSQLHDYIFAGQRVVVWLGLESFEFFTDFKTYKTLTVSVDPSIELTANGMEAIFTLASATNRLLKENLITDRYRGIPHCVHFLTSGGSITRAHSSVHSLSRFTAMVTFRTPSSAAGNTALFRKQTSATNCNWSIRMLTNGHVSVLSSTGLATDVSIETADSFADNEWHTAIFARNDDQTAYFILDNEIIEIVTPTGSTDLPASIIEIGSYIGTDRYGGDVRLYPYMTPSEARLKASQRADGSECVALWRLDDNAGSTANDYSPNNLDATINGTINTDWKWDLTDFGEPELAGNPYPILVGEVFNAKAQLTDIGRKRYRANVDAVDWHTTSPSSNTDLVVKSQGTILTGGGVDYTAPSDGGGGIFSTTSLEAEPVTFDLIKNSSGTTDAWLSVVGFNLANHRTPNFGDEFDINQLTRLGFLCPWKAGWRTEVDATLSKALEDIYGSSGLAYFENEGGDIFVDLLRPPIGYGPFGHPMVEFNGQSGMDFGDVADISGSCTLACWFITPTVNQSATYIANSEFVMISKPHIGTTNYALYLITSGADAGKLAFKIGNQILLSPAGLVEPNELYFVAAIFDDGANTAKINLTKTGEVFGSLLVIASATNSNSPTVNTDSLFVGGEANWPWGAIQFAQVWSTANTLVSLQNQAARASYPAGNEANLVFYAPMTEGQGKAFNLINTVGETLQYPQKWAPRLTVDLNETPSVKLSDYHRMDPAGEIIIKYSKNWFVMSESDIDSGVSQNSKLALKKEWKEIFADDQDILDNYDKFKKIILSTALTTQEGAEKLYHVILNRFGEDRWIGKLTFPGGLDISAPACALQIGDEIGIKSTIPSQLSRIFLPSPSTETIGKSFRVIAVSPNLLNLSTTIVFWG
jgi:hypothetical protein